MAVNVANRQLREPDFVSDVQEIITGDRRGAESPRARGDRVERHEKRPQRPWKRFKSCERLEFAWRWTTLVPAIPSSPTSGTFPLNTLKIDRSFINGVATEGKDAAITSAVIAMAHRLDLRVVAEGVETEDQLSFLSRHDCDECQGFLFSRPVPASEIGEILADEIRAFGGHKQSGKSQLKAG